MKIYTHALRDRVFVAVPKTIFEEEPKSITCEGREFSLTLPCIILLLSEIAGDPIINDPETYMWQLPGYDLQAVNKLIGNLGYEVDDLDNAPTLEES